MGARGTKMITALCIDPRRVAVSDPENSKATESPLPQSHHKGHLELTRAAFEAQILT